MFSRVLNEMQIKTVLATEFDDFAHLAKFFRGALDACSVLEAGWAYGVKNHFQTETLFDDSLFQQVATFSEGDRETV